MWNELETTIFGSNFFVATIDFSLVTRLSSNWNCCAYALTNFKNIVSNSSGRIICNIYLFRTKVPREYVGK